jgi:tetratricopeptide (TPR) repeat protein
MSSRVFPLAAAVAVLGLPAAAPAQQPDPELKSPYLWRVVVQTKPHPLITPAFRDQLKRDLLAALQPGLGVFGHVEVIDLNELPPDQWEVLWTNFDHKGFAALDTDPARDLTGTKTHVLRVEVRDGVFHLESRQYDGFSGLATPTVRRQSTRAPELVGRFAGLMVDRDFGLAGTVEPIANKPDEAVIRVRGGLIGPLEKMVKVGDVFAVSQIRRTTRQAPPQQRTATGRLITPPPGTIPPPAFTAAPRDFTLLKVTDQPKDGTVRCKVLTRWQAPFPASASVAGYRCMKLATVEAPLALRLVGNDGRSHERTSNVNVRATDADFAAKAEARDNLDLREGLFRSSHALSGVACVTITVGTRSDRFPVPVTGTDPVTLRFELDPKAEEKATFELACLSAARRVADARVAQAACFDAVGKLIAARNNGEALARAKAGREAADAADKGLSDELTQLREQLSKSQGAKPVLDSVEGQLARLRKGNEELQGSIRELEGMLAKEKDPRVAGRQVQAEGLNTRIGLLLSRGDVDEAINAYDQLVTLVPDDAAVKDRRAKLQAEWKPRSDEHAKARDYLLRTWPALGTIQDYKESLGTLRNAVETCKKSGDKYAFRKVLTHFNSFAVKLTDLIAPLDGNSDSDRKALEDARMIREQVGKLEQEVADFVKANP